MAVAGSRNSKYVSICVKSSQKEPNLASLQTIISRQISICHDLEAFVLCPTVQELHIEEKYYPVEISCLSDSFEVKETQRIEDPFVSLCQNVSILE